MAVTAYVYAEDEERILNSGFDAYTSKPINAQKLQSDIVDLLKKQLIFMQAYLEIEHKKELYCILKAGLYSTALFLLYQTLSDYYSVIQIATRFSLLLEKG